MGDSWIFVSRFQKFDCGESKIAGKDRGESEPHSGLNLV